MTKFVINELSGVDKPAQAGAIVAIMKRDPKLLPSAPPPGMEVDWDLTKAAAESYLDQHAKVRAAETGKSYAKSYSEILAAQPPNVQSIVLGR